MKKHLLLGALFFGSLMSVHAQNTCDDALQLTAGTTVVGAIDGTYLTFANGGCWQTGATAPNAEWYYIIPDQNSLIRINTNIAANNPVTGDTRISVYTGSCEDLTCYAGNDDVDPDNGPFLSDLTFPAAAGEVYFIAFDDRWSAASFSVEVTVTPTSCFGVETFEYVAAPTTTTATIGWDAPSLGVPTGYIFEYGPMGFTPGTGMTETVSETQIALDGLTPSTDYEFYITTVCGEGNESEVVGPISWSTVFEPANLPYTYGFETPSLNGWSVFTTTGAAGPWDTMVGTSTAWAPQEGETGMAVGAFTTAIDSWLFSRGLNLTANQQVTITYYVRERIGAGNGGVNNLIVTVGNDDTVAAQTTTLATHNDFATSTEWSLQTATFTPSATGVYFLGFHCNSPAQVAANFGWITLDNVTVTGTAGTNENLASQLSVFPNPATNVINVINNKNILVNGIQIVDLNGRTVKSAKFDGVTEAQVNISDLANGVYMMTVSSDKGTMTQKIVKN